MKLQILLSKLSHCVGIVLFDSNLYRGISTRTNVQRKLDRLFTGQLSRDGSMHTYFYFAGFTVLITELEKVGLFACWIDTYEKASHFRIPYFNSFCWIYFSAFHNPFCELDLLSF